MRVYQITMDDVSALNRAFALILDRDSVASALAEPDRLRIRFVASETVAQELLQRIYLDGGLRFSSRHEIVDEG